MWVVRISRTSIALRTGEKLLKVQVVSHCFGTSCVSCVTLQECVRPRAGTRVAAPALCWSEPTADSDRTLRKTVRVTGQKGKKNIVPMSERIFSVWSFKNICQKKSACRLLELKVATFNRACGDYLSCRFQIQLHGSDFAKQIL